MIQIMAWRRPGDKPLSEPMMVSLLTHICVTRPQWVKHYRWIMKFFVQLLMLNECFWFMIPLPTSANYLIFHSWSPCAAHPYPSMRFQFNQSYWRRICKQFTICSSQLLFGIHCHRLSWWRHQMETISALLAICAGNSPVSGEILAQRPVTQSFDVFFDLRLNGRLSKHSWGWWLEMPSRPLWRHSNDRFPCGILGFIDVRSL